jgi:hypothetical protein
VDPRTGLHDVEKRKFLTLPGLELRPHGHPARSQSLHRLRYPGSCLCPVLKISSNSSSSRSSTTTTTSSSSSSSSSSSNDADNNLIQFFIIYMPSQQIQGQLQTQHSVDTSNYIMDKHNIK